MFLIKLFFYFTKMSRQKFKYLENKKSLYDEIESSFHHFLKAFIEGNKANFVWKVTVQV